MTQHSCDQCKDNESAEESRYNIWGRYIGDVKS